MFLQSNIYKGFVYELTLNYAEAERPMARPNCDQMRPFNLFLK